jgi:hypothetical protein
MKRFRANQNKQAKVHAGEGDIKREYFTAAMLVKKKSGGTMRRGSLFSAVSPSFFNS